MVSVIVLVERNEKDEIISKLLSGDCMTAWGSSFSKSRGRSGLKGISEGEMR